MINLKLPTWHGQGESDFWYNKLGSRKTFSVCIRCIRIVSFVKCFLFTSCEKPWVFVKLIMWPCQIWISLENKHVFANECVCRQAYPFTQSYLVAMHNKLSFRGKSKNKMLHLPINVPSHYWSGILGESRTPLSFLSLPTPARWPCGRNCVIL